MAVYLPNRVFVYFNNKYPRSIKGLSSNVERCSLPRKELYKTLYLFESIAIGLTLGIDKVTLERNIGAMIRRINMAFQHSLDENSIDNDLDYIYQCLFNTYTHRKSEMNLKNLLGRIDGNGKHMLFDSYSAVL